MSATDETATSNPTQTPTLLDIAQDRVSRRSVLAGGAVGAAAFLAGGSIVGSPSAGATPGHDHGAGRHRGLLGFTAVAPSTADAVVLPDGYRAEVLIPWGDPIQPGGPAFRLDASNTAAEQAQQIGMGHDGMHFFPVGSCFGPFQHGLLVVNHEYTVDNLLFPDGAANWNAEKTAKSMNAHGVSVVPIARRWWGDWKVIRSPFARRVTANTPMSFSGPAVGHRLLQTAADPRGRRVLGTMNNCANGVTPWGTYLTCEENFNGYFANPAGGGLTDEQTALLERYGVPAASSNQWVTTEERFRADLHPNEPNRFGWVVEIDPFDPDSTPVKHTALGRLKHEGATCTEARDGRVVVYMGDDERFEYIYKFVSSGSWRRMRARRQHPFEHGTLYVARFNADGTGDWLPLVHSEGPLTAANGLADQGDVVVKARLAADLLGATKMDRPEWVAVHPQSGQVYCSLTNNTARTTPDAANPRANNRWGHIVRWNEAHHDAAATGFEWDLYLLVGAGAGTGDGSTIDPEDAFGSPDGLAFDRDGRLWIETDGIQPRASNDQMLASDPATGELRRFLVGVAGCEVTGITWTPDRTTMFVNLQHPGDAGTPENPRAQSNWPDYHPEGRPRPATVVIRRNDGGVIGA